MTAKIGYDSRFYDQNPWMKMTHILDDIWRWISWMRNIVWATALVAWSILATPAYSDSQDSTWGSSPSEVVVKNQEDIVVTLLRISIAGFDMDAFKYEIETNPSILNELSILADTDILYTTRAISESFYRETWITLDPIDLVAVARVVQVSRSGASDPLLLEEVIHDFLSYYTVHWEIFAGILEHNLWNKDI